MKVTVSTVPFEEQDGSPTQMVVLAAKGVSEEDSYHMRQKFLDAADAMMGILDMEVILFISGANMRLTMRFPEDGWEEEDMLDAVYQNVPTELADYFD